MTAKEMLEAVGYTYELRIMPDRSADDVYKQITCTYTLPTNAETYTLFFLSGKDCKEFYFGCDRKSPHEVFDAAVSSGTQHTEAIIQQMRELGWL